MERSGILTMVYDYCKVGIACNLKNYVNYVVCFPRVVDRI